MPMGRRADSRKHARWGELLREFEAGGSSVREFCSGHGLSEHRFYWWRRRLMDTRRTGPACGGGALFVPVRVRPAPAAPPAPAAGDGGRIELLLGGGVTVRLCGEVPAGRLAAVLGVLGVLRERGGQPC